MIDQIARSPWLRKPADDRINDTLAQPPGHRAICVPETHSEVAPVTTEEFIAAEAGQRNLDKARRRLTNVIAGDHRIVCKRLVKRCYDVLDDVRNVGFDIDLVMVQAIAL